MAVVSQSKSSNVYVPGIAGKTPDGSQTSFAMSTIVTKTGGVNDDGSSGFTRQIVRYNDRNEVPSNPNETYVDSNTGLSKRRYRVGDARIGQDALVLYDYGDGTGTPSKIGDVDDTVNKSYSKIERLGLNCSSAVLPGSRLTTYQIDNDRTGVTETHAYRRQFDQEIDFEFYVDASDYIAIRYFEKWMEQIMNQDNTKAKSANYNYRAKYPNEYICDQGLKIYKFERDYDRVLEYQFFKFFPKAISSMPVTYDGNDVLRCNVTMSYVRYIMTGLRPNLAERPSFISTDEPETSRPNTSPPRSPVINTTQTITERGRGISTPNF